MNDWFGFFSVNLNLNDVSSNELKICQFGDLQILGFLGVRSIVDCLSNIRKVAQLF